jgi:peptidyl-prolyl cis-trans isomerase C
MFLSRFENESRVLFGLNIWRFIRMVKQAGYFLVAFLLIGAEAFSQGGIHYIQVKKENIRKKPSGEKIGELLAGTPVEILERSPNWMKVRLTGWIWEKSLTSDSTMVEGFKMRASHILLESEEDANRILNQLKQGADFQELAASHSIDRASGVKGGDLGEFERGDFIPIIENTVLQLKMGGISGVIQTNLGYHIIKRTK